MRSMRMDKWVFIFLLLTVLLPVRAVEFVPAMPEALLINNVTMAPVLPIVEMVGGSISQDLLTATVTITREGKSFTCTPNSTTAAAGNRTLTLEAAPFIRDDMLYVPLRELAQALGGRVVDIEAGSNTVIVRLPGFDQPLHMPFNMDYATEEEAAPDGKPCELYIMRVDGSELRRLTYDSAHTELPALSPDGKVMVYYKQGLLYRRNVDDPAEVVLTPEARDDELRYDGSPLFSPDGARLLCPLAYGKTDLEYFFTMLSPTGEQLPLLMRGTDARFTPDGAGIVYLDGNDDAETKIICRMDLDGGNRRTLTEGEDPIISPNGTTLLFARNGEKEPASRALHTLALTGPDAGKVYAPQPEDLAGDEQGAFSPDGKRIVFAQAYSGIYTMKPDRTDLQMVQLSLGDAIFPAYTPDGARIAFIADNNLCIMAADGSRQRRLTTNITVARFTFTPDGQHIMFTGAPK